MPGTQLLTSQTAAVFASVKDSAGKTVDDGTLVTFTAHGTGTESPGSATPPASRG
jgi:hypothetical protein